MKYILVFVSIFSVICGNNPTRPSNVPAEAFFVGGNNGGVFLNCVENLSNTKIYECVVYYDTTGEIWTKGTFVIKPDENSGFNPSDKNLYNSYDGSRISLKDGRYLIKVQ